MKAAALGLQEQVDAMNVTPGDFTFKLCREASPGERLAAADLTVEVIANLYLKTGLARDMLVAQFAEEFSEEGTELFGAMAVTVSGIGVAGVFSAFDSACRQDLEMGSMLRLLGALPGDLRERFIDTLREHRKLLPAVPPDSFYLARFAVSPRARGTGLAAHMLKWFVDRRGPLATCSLLVDSRNTRAISFYRRHRFEDFAAKENGYLAMWLTP